MMSSDSDGSELVGRTVLLPAATPPVPGVSVTDAANKVPPALTFAQGCCRGAAGGRGADQENVELPGALVALAMVASEAEDRGRRDAVPAHAAAEGPVEDAAEVLGRPRCSARRLWKSVPAALATVPEAGVCFPSTAGEITAAKRQAMSAVPTSRVRSRDKGMEVEDCERDWQNLPCPVPRQDAKDAVADQASGKKHVHSVVGSSTRHRLGTGSRVPPTNSTRGALLARPRANSPPLAERSDLFFLCSM